MNIKRHGAAAGIVAVGALLLSACGTDNNTAAQSPAVGKSTAGINCASGTLTAAGSTAQANAMSTWTKAYLGKCPNANINYGGGGSGQGVAQFQQGTVDFAGSDFPLTDPAEHRKADARCQGGQAIDLPMVPGPIAIGYNVPGVKSLNLSASTLAKIFSGTIRNWNDPAIARDNPGVKLPDLAIQTFHRSDGSGTSYNFTNYLAHVAPGDWSYGTSKNWKAPGGQGSKGTAGIAAGVKQNKGGIGYMELSYATKNHIPYAKIGNAAGKFVPLTTKNVSNFLATAKVVGSGNDLTLKFDYGNTDPKAYPNLLVTYEIVCSKGNDPKKAKLLKSYLSYISGDAAQQTLPTQGYAPLPEQLRSKVADAVKAIS